MTPFDCIRGSFLIAWFGLLRGQITSTRQRALASCYQWINSYKTMYTLASQRQTSGNEVSIEFQYGVESTLGYFHRTDLAHTFFTGFLLFEEFPFPADIPSITFGGYIFP